MTDRVVVFEEYGFWTWARYTPKGSLRRSAGNLSWATQAEALTAACEANTDAFSIRIEGGTQESTDHTWEPLPGIDPCTEQPINTERHG